MKTTDIFIWGLVLGMILVVVVSRRYKRVKVQKMLKRAKAAEKKAVVLLQKWGYTIIDVQLREKVVITIDGKPHESTIRADILVRKGFKRYIVEVKTGQQTSPTLPNVRRQLLEYWLVYQPDGMLLLDMEKEVLKEICFDQIATRRRLAQQPLMWLAAGICLGYFLYKIAG